MEFLQKHYEKILLSMVLLGLAVAAAWLPIKVSSVRQDLQSKTGLFTGFKPKPLPAPDLSTNQTFLKRAQRPEKSVLGKPGHNVFNPIAWQKKADGTPVPKEETGLKALVIQNLNPLHLKIEFQGPRPSGEVVRYQFLVTREAATNRMHQSPMMMFATAGSKNDVFTLKEVKGPKEDPQELLLELNDPKVEVAVSRTNAFAQVAGYSVDLRHDPENKSFNKQRAGQKVTLGGVGYNIVAITKEDVTLEDTGTRKRTTIRVPGAQ